MVGMASAVLESLKALKESLGSFNSQTKKTSITFLYARITDLQYYVRIVKVIVVFSLGGEGL